MSHAKKEQRFWDKSWTQRQPTLTGLVTGTNSCTAGPRKFKGTRINAIEPLQALRLHKFMSPKQWWLSVSGSDLVLDTLFFLYMTPVCRDMLLCPETAQSAWNTSQLLSLYWRKEGMHRYIYENAQNTKMKSYEIKLYSELQWLRGTVSIRARTVGKKVESESRP